VKSQTILGVATLVVSIAGIYFGVAVAQDLPPFGESSSTPTPKAESTHTPTPSDTTPEPSPVSTPVRTPTILERLAGSYALESWDESRADTITIWVDVRSGTLEIDKTGNASWKLFFDERGESHDPEPYVICEGRFRPSSEKIEGIQGGVDGNWTSDIMSIRNEVHLSLCGRAIAEDDDPYRVSIEDLSEGAKLLEMRNSRGVFTWTSNGGSASPELQ
jgi:hypothetical protein